MSSKLEFVKDVLHLIHDISKLVFNLSSDADIERVYGVTESQLEALVTRIINALPDNIFNHLDIHTLDEMKGIFAKEFIFFQVQEKPNEQEYEADLNAFIEIFSRDMQSRLKNSLAKGEVK